MRSGSATLVGLMICLLTGCTTTQQKAAWLRVNSARLRASQYPTRVPRLDSRVRVTGLSAVRQGGDTALIVTLENLGTRSVSDLPILAGYRVGHHRPVYLNAAAGLDYFQSHLPAIGARGWLRWVFTSTHRLPRAARPFAEVGPALPVGGAPSGRLPRIVVQQLGQVSGGQVRVKVTNASSIPQYQLQLYAVASRGTRPVAAGHASFEELGSGAAEPITVRLVGSTTSRRVALEAPPTIFS